jgi:NADH-quinone oxidoreductase subunit L
VYLTFHGPRAAAAVAPGATAHPPAHPEEEEPAAHRGTHAHGHLHDAPMAMAIVLILLAIGSVLAGYIGVPHALGGDNRIERFLHPAFVVAEGAEGAGADLAHAADGGEPGHADETLELTLMGVSTGIALLGIGLATFFFLKRRDRADRMAERFPGTHRLLLNKYYVDELYDAAIVQPIKQASTVGLWRGFDVGLVDGAVNGTGALVGGSSEVLRRLQTGSMRTYAASLFLGVVVILGYYLWW